ncbi:MAG: hypothetical protein ACK41C_10460 [Phenylobacterium sp.]|uniref:hypothetical protein n=1 Tax=Phenylobacterium sp. TaxID=1871053 RepID=UPI00391DB73E
MKNPKPRPAASDEARTIPARIAAGRGAPELPRSAAEAIAEASLAAGFPVAKHVQDALAAPETPAPSSAATEES